MNTRKFALSLTGASALCLAALPRPAGAQETMLLDRMVVTAGQEKVAIETPQSVTVVDQEDIDREQGTTIGDVLTDLPGVKAIGSDRVLGESFNIRGLGTLGSSDESRLIVQVDGATKFHEQYRMGSFFSDPEFYKRIEVLRGPASSTLYGAGALAGVISLTTKDASDFLDGEKPWAIREKLEFNDNRGGFLSSTVGALAPTENTELLGMLSYRRSDQFKDGDGNIITGSDFDAPSGLVKGKVDFGADEEHELRASYQHWVTQANNQDYSQTGTVATFGTIDREVTDQTAILGYGYTPADNDLIDLDAQLSFTNTQVEQTNASLQGAFGGSALFEESEYAYEIWQGSLENTFTTTGDGFENYLTIGTDLAFQTRTADTAVTATSPTGGVSFHPGGESQQYGIYAQNELVLWDRFTLIPGLRLDHQRLEPAGSVTVTREEVNNTAISPKLAAHYQVNDTLGVFGSVAYTERLPVLDEIYDAASSNLNLDPETSLNFETGAALSFQDVWQESDAVSAKATVFLNQIDNLIERANTTSPYTNVGEAEIYGLELEAAYESKYAFARGALTVLRGEDSATGASLNSIPADELALTIGGRIPDKNIEFGWRGVFAVEQDRVSGTTTPSSGYVVHDLFASWKPETGILRNGELRFGVQNLFDQQYQEHLAGDPGKGRTFMLTVAKQF